MKLIHALAGLMALTAVVTARADAPQQSIVSHIAETDTTVEIVIPEALLERLRYIEPAKESTSKPRNGMPGYRVQVFSDNNVRTAKNEARSREMTVASRFPQYRAYRMYSAPYWRVRVGDFRTQSAAESAAQDLRRAFPSFGKEIRVVRDRIYVVE